MKFKKLITNFILILLLTLSFIVCSGSEDQDPPPIRPIDGSCKSISNTYIFE